MRLPLHLCLSLLPIATLVACGQEAQGPAARASLGPVPAAEQRPGDPAQGREALLNNAYVTCGAPYEAYKAATDTPPPSQRLPGREGRNAELPYWLTAHENDDGVELVTSNCLTCHAGHFNGELVIGLGDETRDFTEDPRVFAESVGRYVSDGPAAEAWRRWADRVAAIAPYMITDTVGVNPANNLTLALFAHHDRDTLAWSDEPLIEPPPKEPPPVSVPPWWRMGKKHAMFYSAEGRGDHARWMMTAAILCTDTVSEARAIDRYFPHIRAYIASLEPPDYPFPVDSQLAGRGQQVFEAHCSRCHGRYGEQESYPNLVIGLDEVGTDPELAEYMGDGADRFVRWFNDSFFGEQARAAPAPGYVAPPLDGVWATAPYLHNGSVPTLRALLDSSQRPRYWARQVEDRKYDDEALGWRHRVLDHGKPGAANPEERKRIYDTTLPGYSNQGHTFGDALSKGERQVLLEYIKTL